MSYKNYIDSNIKIFAHVKDDSQKELLDKHIELCVSYWKKIFKNKGMDKILNKFSEVLFGTVGKSKWLTTQMREVVEFHDVGKINPMFQKNKMNSKEDVKANLKCVPNSNHSLLSSVLYFDYVLDIYNLLGSDIETNKEKQVQFLIVCINAYVISRHHSDLTHIDTFFSQYDENGEANSIINELKREDSLCKLKFFNENSMVNCARCFSNCMDGMTKKQTIALFTYCRLLYSFLVSCDYYATTEFMNGISFENMDDKLDVRTYRDTYEKTDLIKKIRSYSEERVTDTLNVHDINVLRTEMFLDAETEYKKHKDKRIFYLDAPTGSGKSNTAVNLSLLMAETCPNKIFYIYPFNTLVEQNQNNLRDIFGEDNKLIRDLGVINSVEPIKRNEEHENSEDELYYQTALLDYQFQNYPLVMSTHVSLFKTMFNCNKEAVLPFMQLCNSVIILDEIQSYKNTIWTEIISFLNIFSELLNIKILIMSGTLPDIGMLSIVQVDTVNLITDKDKYYQHELFKKRVNMSYELLKEDFSPEKLAAHISSRQHGKKIMVEFISRKKAFDFYNKLKSDKSINSDVYLLRGDDNLYERARIIDIVKKSEKGVILISTQVIEAGVDLDVDIGYKDISKLDSEEQFMGRINRSCKGNGEAFFFNWDKTNMIYKDDIRIDKDLTLGNDEMKKILVEKNFADYYSKVMERLKECNESFNEAGLDNFFRKVAELNLPSVQNRMTLIDENQNKITVFFNRTFDEGGIELIGSQVWSEYKELLLNNSINYAKKKIRLSEMKKKLSFFMYEVPKKNQLIFDDIIGEMGYIENSEPYFIDGKLNYEALVEGQLTI